MATRKRPWEKEKETSTPGGSWGSLPANLRPLADLPGEVTPQRMGDIRVLVSVHNEDLGNLSDRVWLELNAKLIAAGGAMTVTLEELTRYFATAIYSRVMWVNRTMREGAFRPADKWALPVAMHMVVSAIGNVDGTGINAGIRYVPVWDVSGADLLLNRAEWENITVRLLALEPYGLRFVKAYEQSEVGVEKVMSLARIDEPEETYFYAWVPPHVLETIIAAVLGIRRIDPGTIDPLNRESIPPYRMRGRWVLRWMHDFARMNEHRDVA